jgi:hypothetical protein
MAVPAYGVDPFRDAVSAAILQKPSKMSGALYGGAGWSTRRSDSDQSVVVGLVGIFDVDPAIGV